MLASTTYFWQVTARNATGSTPGPIWSFTTASGTTAPGLLVQDTFTGTPGTLLTAHAPDVNVTGNAWTLNGGAPTPTLVAGGGVGVTSGPGHLQVTINSGVADIAMGIDYRVGAGPGMGALVFRLTDANNFLLLETYANALYLFKRQAGDWVPLASQPLPAMLMIGQHASARSADDREHDRRLVGWCAPAADHRHVPADSDTAWPRLELGIRRLVGLCQLPVVDLAVIETVRQPAKPGPRQRQNSRATKVVGLRINALIDSWSPGLLVAIRLRVRSDELRVERTASGQTRAATDDLVR